MKKILLACICLIFYIQPVFADDLPSEETNLEGQVQTQTPVVVDITQLLNNNTDKAADNTDEEITPVIALEPQLVNVTQSQQRISASDTTGFKSVILSLIGDYETTITDYEYRTNSSYTSHSINIERDWSWICSCGIFAILLICTFKTIGSICSKM